MTSRPSGVSLAGHPEKSFGKSAMTLKNRMEMATRSLARKYVRRKPPPDLPYDPYDKAQLKERARQFFQKWQNDLKKARLRLVDVSYRSSKPAIRSTSWLTNISETSTFC